MPINAKKEDNEKETGVKSNGHILNGYTKLKMRGNKAAATISIDFFL